jgi:hypothetical protein
MIRSFTFPDCRTAYDCSQTDDDIRDGDVLLVPSEGRAAVLLQAWPTLAYGTEPGCFHTLADTNWTRLDGGHYLPSAIVAIALSTVETLKAAGLSAFTGDVPRMYGIARQHGWDGVPTGPFRTEWDGE